MVPCTSHPRAPCCCKTPEFALLFSAVPGLHSHWVPLGGLHRHTVCTTVSRHMRTAAPCGTPAVVRRGDGVLRLCGVLALLACADAATSCVGFAGKWHDEASDDWMKVAESNCELTTKYGKARVQGVAVTPTAGIFSTLGLAGQYSEGTRSIRWSNGVTWTRMPGTDTHESRIASLESIVSRLSEENTALKAEVADLAKCTNCHPAATAPPTPPPTGPQTPPAPVDLSQAPEIKQLQERLDTLNSSIANAVGTPGRDGYCAVQPNVTSVYIPVNRYPRRSWMADDVCVVGGQASIGSLGTPGTPSMMTTPTLRDVECRWTWNLLRVPMYAYVGDTMVFWRGSDKSHNVYLMRDSDAFKQCDFTGATLIAGLIDLEAAEANNHNFTYTFEKAGTYYLASDKAGARGDDRKEYCWAPLVDGAYSGKPFEWGQGTKLEVIVLDPTQEVKGVCPLYDPSKYGVSEGQEVDSKSVERLKGAVGAISRQLIALEVRMQERVRAEGNSGLTVTRSSVQGTDAYHQEAYSGSGPANIHNHANFKYTIGMGETGAVLNGVQFTTRHNDYSMLQPDDTLSAEEYVNSWPPKSRELDFPAVPPSVTGTVDEQIKEMREYFRAFHNQDTSIRADYDKYFKPNLCYLEGTWAEAQDDIVEPFASDRHHIDADTWEDLNNKVNFLFNNGQKSNPENLPYLPSSFRGMRESKAGDVFEPRIGQWFYRINCVPIKEKISTKRFRVKNDVHVQLGETPSTRETLGSTTRALFELNPTLPELYNTANEWPKGRTQYEYIDRLMESVPGFDGPKGNLEDRSFLYRCAEFLNTSNVLNTARYSRYFAMLEKDAMGVVTRKRGFNDYLFAAQTTHPSVSPQEACDEFEGVDDRLSAPEDLERKGICAALNDKFSCYAKTWDKNQVTSDASGAKCTWNGYACKYKKCWSQRWSYAIPLEVIYSTPLTNWNPYNIEHHEPGNPGFDNVLANGRNGATPATAYDGARLDHFFRTPASFFKDPKNVNPADTSGGVTYVKDKTGTVQQVRASGHWILFPEIEGVGNVRQRYPIMPVHEAGSATWKEAKAIQELLMGGDVQRLKAILAETRVEAYGAELRLLAGQGHDHKISITAGDVKSLKAGNVVQKTSSTDSGHAHLVELKYDVTRGAGREFVLSWCTTRTSAAPSTCPASVLSQPGLCGKTSDEQPCCYNKCPDNHPGVELIA